MTEIRIQTINNERIKVLEAEKEDTKQELQCLYETLEEIKKLQDRTKPNTTAGRELKLFVTKLKKEIEINNEILDEYKQGIEFIKNG
jgi:uncharacterized protein YacL (UPF0231 family)